MTKKLVILGAGFQGRHTAEMVSGKSKTYKEIIFLDDDENLWGHEFDSNKVLGGISLINTEEFLNNFFVVGVGMFSMRLRSDLYSVAEKTMKPVTIMHETSFCSKSASVGKGSVLFPNSVVNYHAVIGSNCVLYTGVILEHNSILQNNVWLSPGSYVAGNVEIGENTFVGIGANISHNVRIGKNCVVGAGATVLNNVPDNETVVGVPARII